MPFNWVAGDVTSRIAERPNEPALQIAGKLSRGHSGALAQASEPGIQLRRRCLHLDSGPGASRRPGMTAGEFFSSLLEDLTIPPSNRLEKLKGDLKDFYSIRINDQWRVIFKWINGEPHEVRIVDYH